MESKEAAARKSTGPVFPGGCEQMILVKSVTESTTCLGFQTFFVYTHLL